MIIDGTDLILGRMAAFVAKKALLGETIDIVNCENIVISGDKRVTLAKYKKFRVLGIQPNWGPFQPRIPDRFVRRAIKRMLPMSKPRGREAFHRIMCHMGVPTQFRGQELVSLKEANVSRLSTLKYVSVKELCHKMGGKF